MVSTVVSSLHLSVCLCSSQTRSYPDSRDVFSWQDTQNAHSVPGIYLGRLFSCQGTVPGMESSAIPFTSRSLWANFASYPSSPHKKSRLQAIVHSQTAIQIAKFRLFLSESLFFRSFPHFSSVRGSYRYCAEYQQHGFPLSGAHGQWLS